MQPGGNSGQNGDMHWEYLVLFVKVGLLETGEPLEVGTVSATVGQDQLPAGLNQLGAMGWEAYSTVFHPNTGVTQVFLKRVK